MPPWPEGASDDERPSFGSLLKEHRLAQGLSQEALAEGAGLSREAISLLERGLRRSPHRDTVRLLAKTLKLSPADQARLRAAASERRELAPAEPAPILPPRLTSFIGREEELAELRELVLAKRLVTLTGPGGIGKTSLALAVAAAVSSRFADGVALVDLAVLADGELIPYAIAAALGVRERADQPILTTLGVALGRSQRLLVLDNCEHLLLGCGHLVESLLRSCPHLTILTTSREALRIGPEVIWRVPPLAVPPPPPDPGTPGGRDAETSLAASLPPGVPGSTSDGVDGYEAVRLFVERAGAVRPGFALTRENVEAIAEICRRLDGIPLAIELAAARVGALPPEQIARHLDDRFRLLTTGSRTSLPRHQTLRALFDWSHDLLSEEERILFRRLAVFTGGWTLEAAEALGGGEGMNDVLDLLLGLVDKSLVLAEERDGEARYRFLETAREYAREKLEASGETAATEAAHAAYFASWVGGPGPQAIEMIVQRDAALPLDAVAAERENLRAALGYFLEQGEAEMGLGLAARVYHLWFMRGPREEGRTWLRRLLALPVPASVPSRAAALFAAGWLAQLQDGLVEARASYTEAATLALARGDLVGRAFARGQLGQVASLQGDPARARAELEEGIRLARQADAPQALASSLVRFGHLALAQGNLAEAERALAEGRTVLPGLPSMRFLFDWLAGGLALAQGRGAQAAREYRTALADRWTVRDPMGVAISALGLAEVAAVARDGARAARLLGGSEGIALGVGGRPILDAAVQRTQPARVEAAARELLGDEAFAVLWAEGRRLSVEEVVRLALVGG